MSEHTPPPARPKAPRHAGTALVLAAVVAGMTGLSFAAVPLYRMFCQTTGFGGTTQRAASAPAEVSRQTVTVRFDANVAPGLPWLFEPEEREIKLKFGENRLTFFRATNRSNRPTTGTAVFNVTPETAGAYFTKIQCFCFNEQTLEPGQTAEMAVSFFVDPAYLSDGDTKSFQDITLSYTFFPAARQAGTGQPAGTPASALSNKGT